MLLCTLCNVQRSTVFTSHHEKHLSCKHQRAASRRPWVAPGSAPFLLSPTPCNISRCLQNILLIFMAAGPSHVSMFVFTRLHADPYSMQPQKALDTIGKNLQAQYERWQPKVCREGHVYPAYCQLNALPSPCTLFDDLQHQTAGNIGNGRPWCVMEDVSMRLTVSLMCCHVNRCIAID